jgi:solute:Na+ symporter, SSS family
MQTFDLAIIDIVVMITYIIAIIGFGLWVSRKNDSEEDYFLAGRSLTWPVIGFSLFASNVSSSTLIGLAGDAYTTGIAVYNYEWFAVIVLVFFIIFFLPFYLKTKIYTLPEFLELRFDHRSRYYMSGVTVVGNILLETAGALYAGALVVVLIFPNVPMWQITTVLALLAGAYTIAGGLKAVVYTDSIQAVLLLLGSTLIAWFAYQKVGSWDAVLAVTTPSELSLIQPLDDPALPWLGLVVGLPLLGIYFWCSNQFMVQRTLAAKNLDEGRWGSLFAGLLKLPIIFIMVFPGIFARVLYPNLEKGDMVFPTMIFDLLPDGIRGLILVVLIAAIMSSLDSTLNSVSTLVTMDWVKKFKPHLSGKKLVLVGRIATGVVMILGAIWAPQIAKFPSLWQYLQGVLAYITPPIVACFILGVFWRRSNGTGAFAGLILGFIMAIVLLVAPVDLHFLYVAPILFGLSCITIVIASLATSPPSPESQKLVWTVSMYHDETRHLRQVRWFKNYRIQSALLLALTALVVSMFI